MEKEKKEYTKLIRLTKNELEKIQNLAKNNSMNFSQYLIFKALNKSEALKQFPLRKEAILQLSKIGTNLNQIAKIANQEQAISNKTIYLLAENLAELEIKIQEVIKKL